MASQSRPVGSTVGKPENAYDVVIVGGGPAGLAAALEVAPFGLRVALIDEHNEFGGQYFKRRSPNMVQDMGDFRPKGSALVRAVRATSVDCWTETTVWGADRGELWVSRSGTVERITAKAIVVATGAFERSVPFAGWTLPGVCTPGFALHLATMDGVAVGRRVVVAGTGPFLLSVASALLTIGIDVPAVVELNRPYRFSATAAGTVRYPRRIAELAGYFKTLVSHRVPIKQGWRVYAAIGKDRVERVAIGRGGAGKMPEAEIEVDAVCVAFGFRPAAELVRLMGAEFRFDSLTDDYLPSTDEEGRATIEGVYVAGEVAGVAGAGAALTRGALAGLAALHDLGVSTSRLSHRRQALRARLIRELRFANLAARLFPVPQWLYDQIPDDVPVCRCESVTAGVVRRTARDGHDDIHSVKGRERVGMGPCQGRTCWNAVAGLLRPISGNPDLFNVRMPLKPLPIRELIAPSPLGGQ